MSAAAPAAPWLHVIGIGEDGVDGLSPAARALLESAEVIVGGDRHHALSPNVTAERLSWPSPFDALIDRLRAERGRRLVVLATGDPLWYSVGARILKAIRAEDVAFHPQLSAFQWASARMRWSLADVETVTAHGRPPEQVVPFLAPDARLLVLTKDRTTPARLAEILTARGYGPSTLTVLGALGGAGEMRAEGVAAEWAGSAAEAATPDFHTLAIACRATPGAALAPRGPGLPDDLFRHDGMITKREVRAATLAKLWPVRRGVLWDIGAGCGSVAIEWMRAARDAEAVGFEPDAARRAMAAENALALGAPRLTLVGGRAPAALSDAAVTAAGLGAPDAVFIGGGLSEETVARCWAAMKPQGRLVANAVTLESEALLLKLYAERGGDLARLSVARAAPIGGMTGWRPSMPVTQWSLVK